ncbi:MAG: dimethylhistidine N-methyltransferase, partial [Phenylobacterium sp.]
MNKKNIHFHDFHSGHCDFAQSILKSLGTKPATIAPKFFYDSQGAQLFDAITELPEYYQTRTEMAILSANVDQIASQVGTGSVLIEPGGGNCAKIHILLDGLKPDVYIPMDIAKEHLRQSSQELALAFGWLEIHATCIDYSDEMRLPPFDSSFDKKGHRVVFFPGSTIGNFTPQESIDFLSSIAQMIGPDGYLLIGVDLKKDKAMLEAAYDDAAGITARFNLNLLTRINRELGGNFDLDAWQHKALY